MKRVLLAAAAAMMTATAAQADVIYDVSGSFEADADGDSINEVYLYQFSYTAPTFITALTETAPTSCSISGSFYQCAATSTFDPGSTTFGPPVPADFFAFKYDNVNQSGGGSSFYFFQPGAFAATGVYSNAGQPNPSGPLFDPNGDEYAVGNAGPATLTVRQSLAGAVPEPATWAMMIAGFGVIGAGMRRRGNTFGRPAQWRRAAS